MKLPPITIEFEEPAPALYKEAPMAAPQRKRLNTWERVNCASLAAILATLLLLAGVQMQPATATAPQAAPAAVQQVTSEPVESDQEPSGIEGMTIAELHADAAATLASMPAQASSGQFELIPEYAASYADSVPEFPATYFHLESIQHPGVFHVFNVIAAQRA